MKAAIPFPDFSPELFSITLFGIEFALRWYALAYIAGILIAWRLGLRAIRRAGLWPGDTPPLTEAQLEDLMTWIILGVILGGRLGFVLFYQPAYYLANPAEILMVWQGGMSFHGGLMGVIVGCYIFALRNGIAKLPLADLVAHTVPPGLFLGRVANFINGELWGRPTDMPWGVIFPGPFAQDCPGVAGLCARHPSQLYEAALEGLVLGLFLLWLVYRRDGLRRPGLVTGFFLLGYGCARLIVEFFRQPDAQFVTSDNPLGLALHFGGTLGLTMGQILSLPMMALGLWLVLQSDKRRQA